MIFLLQELQENLKLEVVELGNWWSECMCNLDRDFGQHEDDHKIMILTIAPEIYLCLHLSSRILLFICILINVHKNMVIF